MKSGISTYLLLLFCFCTYRSAAQKTQDSVVLRKIYFSGNKRTRATVMLREMSVKEGQKIASADIEELMETNRKRLMNLPLFSEVIVTTDTLKPGQIDWKIDVKEQFFILPEITLKLADRNFNVWWNEKNHNLRRLNAGVNLKHRNFRGNLEQLSATVQVGYTQKLGLEYFRPYIDKQQKNGIGASFFLAKNEEIYYITDSNKLLFVRKPGNYIIRQFEAAMQYVHRPGYATKHTVELRFRDFKIDDTIARLNPDYFKNASRRLELLELTYRFDYNGVDNWNYPLTGLKMVGHLVGRQGFKGMNWQAYAHAELGYFRKLVNRLYVAGIFRGRLTAPNDVPYYLRNAMGSNSEYVRGYEYYVVDGSQYAIGRADLKFEALNIKIRHVPISFLSVIPIRVYPKIFVDAGYATYKYPGNSFLNERALIGYGVGVDVVSSYEFKFRLEYSFNHLQQKGLFLHLDTE